MLATIATFLGAVFPWRHTAEMVSPLVTRFGAMPRPASIMKVFDLSAFESIFFSYSSFTLDRDGGTQIAVIRYNEGVDVGRRILLNRFNVPNRKNGLLRNIRALPYVDSGKFCSELYAAYLIYRNLEVFAKL